MTASLTHSNLAESKEEEEVTFLKLTLKELHRIWPHFWLVSISPNTWRQELNGCGSWMVLSYSCMGLAGIPGQRFKTGVGSGCIWVLAIPG